MERTNCTTDAKYSDPTYIDILEWKVWYDKDDNT